MQTTWRQRQRIEEDLMAGRMPTEQEVMALVHDANAGEHLEHELAALKIALEEVGFAVIDTTTDDDDGTVLEIVKIEEP